MGYSHFGRHGPMGIQCVVDLGTHFRSIFIYKDIAKLLDFQPSAVADSQLGCAVDESWIININRDYGSIIDVSRIWSMSIFINMNHEYEPALFISRCFWFVRDFFGYGKKNFKMCFIIFEGESLDWAYSWSKKLYMSNVLIINLP